MKELSKVHSEICSSLMGTYFKTQLKLTHFIKSMFQKQQIGGLVSRNMLHA